jgi:hypothetical protein
MRFESIHVNRGVSTVALTLAFALLTGQLASAQFMHETTLNATPYDVDLTPNGLIAVVRGNSAEPANLPSNNRVSFWRTDVTSSPLAKITPNQPLVGRGNLTTNLGAPTVSNAIAVNAERAVIIGSADTTGDPFEDTTYVDVVSFDYTQSPPTVTVLSTTALGGGVDESTMAGEAHDVAITPDGMLAVVAHRNWIHVFELMTGSVVKSFNVGGADSPQAAGPCGANFSRNSLELTNDHAVVTMARRTPSFPTINHSTWVYVVDLSYSPPTTLPTLVLEHKLLPVGEAQQKPHDLAISPDGTLAGISSWATFGLYHLAPGAATFLAGDYDSFAWKESVGDPSVSCGNLWDSIEMSDSRAVVYWNVPHQNGEEPPCPYSFRWTAEVFDISTLQANSLGEFSDNDGSIGWLPLINPAWDIAMSDDGEIVAVGNGLSSVALVDVDTSAPFLERFWGYGAALGPPSPLPSLPPNSMMNETVAVTRGFVTPVVWPQPSSAGLHRWLAYTRTFAYTTNPYLTTVGLYDLPQYLVGNDQKAEFTYSDATQDTVGVDVALNASQTEVLVRRSAPPDEPDPTTGGRDWSRYSAQSTSPSEIGATLGGKGFAVGVDNLVQRRGVAVSISAHLNQANTGYVHVVRTF